MQIERCHGVVIVPPGEESSVFELNKLVEQRFRGVYEWDSEGGEVHHFYGFAIMAKRA